MSHLEQLSDWLQAHPVPKRGHAYLSPSSFARYLKCPVSARRENVVEQRRLYLCDFLANSPDYDVMAKNLMQVETEAADDGRFCHRIFEDLTRDTSLLAENKDPMAETQRLITFFLKRYGATEALQDDLQFRSDFAKQILWVKEILKKALWFRNEVRIPLVSMGVWGTADLVFETEDRIHIYDLKTGRLEVSAENNEQFMTYAVGIMDAIGWDVKDIEFGVVGVRFESNTFLMSAEKLKAWKEDVLRPGIAEAHNPGAAPLPGLHCMHCTAKQFCKAWFDMAKETLDRNMQIFDNDHGFAERDNTELIDAYIWAKQVEKFTNDMKNEIALRFEGLSDIESDGRVRYVRPKPIAKYKDEKAAAKYLEENFPIQAEEFVVKKAVNPALLKEVVVDKVYDDLVEVESRKPYIKLA